MFTKEPTSPEPRSFEELVLQAESVSPGLSETEVFAVLDIDPEDLNEQETKKIIRAIIRGKALANKQAVGHLFDNMKGKGGERACIDYLKRFAEEWPLDEQYESGKGGGSFTVNLGD